MDFFRQHSRLLSSVYKMLDLAILLLATWLAAYLAQSPGSFLFMAPAGALLQVFFFDLFRVYRSWRGSPLTRQIGVLTQAWLGVLVSLCAVAVFLERFDGRAVLFWGALAPAGFVSLRAGVKVALRLIRRKGYNRRRALVAGATELGLQLAEHVERAEWTGIEIIGFLDDRLEPGADVPNGGGRLKVAASTSEAADYCASNDIDMVFIALPMRAEKKINELLWTLGTGGVIVYLVPDLFAFGLQKANLHRLGELALMSFNLFPPWKRWFDIVFSLLALTLTLPLWIPMALLIKREDGGPVFYGHPRVTERGKRFTCLKFRTMRVDADRVLEEHLQKNPNLREEWERTYKLRDDPRVTRVGRLLRRYSLDELPQFLNVLTGRMSVVGARPVVPEELEKYYRESALAYCAMKPGITDPWQVGARSDAEDYGERVALDRWYVLNAGILVDLSIIARTVVTVLKGRGA